MNGKLIQGHSSNRVGLRTAAVLAAAGLLALAGCSGEGEGTASGGGVVQTANAQESTAPAATPAPNSTPLPGAAAPAAPAPAAPSTAAAVEAPEPDGTVDVAALMAPGSLPDVVMGDPNAPVTIIEYASMTCGHCAAFHTQTLPTIKKDYIDTGKAKLILREFPFDQLALAAFMLARCAPDDKRDAMIGVLFEQQSKWVSAENKSEALLNIGKLAGFTQQTFETCLNDKDLQAKIVETQQRGENEFKITGTPTLFVNGNRYGGSMGAPELAAVIDSML